MSSARFFQGNSVLGPVHATSLKTFKDVVDALRMRPLIPMTRERFLALPEKERNEKKKVPFFVPACFKESPSKRAYDQATYCNLIFLDIDPEKKSVGGKYVENGKYPAAPFVRNPDSLYTHLSGFNFAAHVTASSTPEKPRMRIIVEANQIPLELYPRAAEAVAALLGLNVVTKESKVAVQPMFLPVVFTDTPDEHDPLLAWHIDGRPFQIADIGEDVSEAYDVKPTKDTPDISIDALEFLRAPVPEITLAVIKEPLFSIDADCSRPQWLDVAAAMKHQYAPHKEDAAYTLFDEWSQTGEKYGGADETRKLWDSLKPTPIGRVPVTVRTILHFAAASGWNDTRVKETCFASIVKWLEEVSSPVELMERGVKKILATPLITAMQEDVLVSQLCAQAKKRFCYSISATAVRKDLARIKAQIREQEKPVDRPKEPIWTKGVCYVSAPQEFYRHKTGEKYKVQAFNSIYSRHLLPTIEELKAAGIPATEENLSKPLVLPEAYAMNFIKIPTVYDYAYDPSQPADVIFVHRGSKFVNTYSPTYPEADPKRAAYAGELLLQHLSHLVAEEEYRRTLIDFMAFMVQSPGRKIRWAVMIQSAEGAGKTYLSEVMKAVLGVEHVKTIDGSSIKSGWNEWAFGKQLVVLEEVRVVGTSKHEVMNALKPLITNDDISISQRFRDQRQVPNCSNYMLFSNHHDALALTPGDRRYFVIKSPIQSKAQVLALGENYFPPLYAILRESPGAMRAFLQDWEISPDFRADGHAPRTKYVNEMVQDSASELTYIVRQMLLEGDLPLVQYDIVSSGVLKTAIEQTEGLKNVTAQHVAHVLREEGFENIGRHMIGDDRHGLWMRPGMNAEQAIATAQERHKLQLKNLCMELLFQ